MRIEIADNNPLKIFAILTEAIEGSIHSRLAAAFVSMTGLDLIRPAIDRCLSHGGHLEFLVGMDMTTSEPEALWDLYRLCQKNQSVTMYCFGELKPLAIYHPKLYFMNSEEEATAIIGSSNLTRGGLKNNLEINTVIHALAHEEIVSDILDVYNKLKFHPKRVEPDEELLSLYEQLCRGQKVASKNSATKSITRELRKKISTLRHPVPTKKDLSGWQRLIYSRLPDGEFANEEIYAYEEEFRQHYPGNRNIRPKIRQKLQELREMGLVRHLGRARWSKADEQQEN